MGRSKPVKDKSSKNKSSKNELTISELLEQIARLTPERARKAGVAIYYALVVEDITLNNIMFKAPFLDIHFVPSFYPGVSESHYEYVWSSAPMLFLDKKEARLWRDKYLNGDGTVFPRGERNKRIKILPVFIPIPP